MDGLSGSKTAQVLLPIAGGLLSAATPGLGRGVITASRIADQLDAAGARRTLGEQLRAMESDPARGGLVSALSASDPYAATRLALRDSAPPGLSLGDAITRAGSLPAGSGMTVQLDDGTTVRLPGPAVPAPDQSAPADRYVAIQGAPGWVLDRQTGERIPPPEGFSTAPKKGKPPTARYRNAGAGWRVNDLTGEMVPPPPEYKPKAGRQKAESEKAIVGQLRTVWSEQDRLNKRRNEIKDMGTDSEEAGKELTRIDTRLQVLDEENRRLRGRLKSMGSDAFTLTPSHEVGATGAVRKRFDRFGREIPGG